MVGSGYNAQPALFARDNSTVGPSAGQLWYYSPATLAHIVANPPTDIDTATSNPPVQLATSGWDSDDVPLIQAANLNGIIALRALGGTPGFVGTNQATATTYLLNAAGTGFTTPGATQTITTTTHSWPLNDATDGPVAGAADTPANGGTAMPLVATVNDTTKPGATWVDGDLFDSNVNLNGNARLYANPAAGKPAVDLTGSFSVSAWVYPSTLNGVVLSQDGSANSGFVVYPTSSDWVFGLNKGSGTQWTFDAVEGGQAQLNVWTHLTVTYDKPTAVMNLYVDDVLVATGNHTAPSSGASGAFQIGDDLNSSIHTSYFTGQVAQVQTWTGVALPPARGYTPASYHQSLKATRLLDTRTTTGAVLTNRGSAGASTPVPPQTTLTLQMIGDAVTPSVAGAPQVIPVSATAVAVDITVTNASANGYLTAFPDGTQQPITSTSNFTPAGTTGYQIVPLGLDGKIALFNGAPASVDMIVDISGYFTTDSSLAGNQTYHPLSTAARALDTRVSTVRTNLTKTGTVPANSTFTLQITGASGVPGVPAGASAVAINLTAVSESGGGYLKAYATGAAPTLDTSLTYSTSAVAAANADVPLSTSGSMTINNNIAATAVIVDVAGYYTTTVDSTSQLYHAVSPTRLMDTRSDLGGFVGPISANHVLILDQTAISQITNSVTPTLALNLTAVDSSTQGDLVAYPDGGTQPSTSNLNFDPGPSTANLAMVPTGTGTHASRIDILNQSTGTVHLVIDCGGYFSTN
jgi:hypothetical protein